MMTRYDQVLAEVRAQETRESFAGGVSKYKEILFKTIDEQFRDIQRLPEAEREIADRTIINLIHAVNNKEFMLSANAERLQKAS